MAANVLLAKCNAQNKTYGIRVEQRGTDWVSTWAFKIDETKAKREGFHKTKITGSFRPAPEYPGCPYCGGNNLVQCGCGKMFCYNENPTNSPETNGLQCPWCGIKIQQIQTVESFTVNSGGY